MSTAATRDGDSAPLPPPKDHVVPPSLRLGTNLLGLGLGPIGRQEQDEALCARSVASSSSRRRGHTIAEGYDERARSGSTVSLSTRSILTITPVPPSPCGTAGTMTTMVTPTTQTSSKGSRRPKLKSSVSFSDAPTPTKRRGSGQLLSGLGRGLGRMGSVMRRNTSDGAAGSNLSASAGSSKGGSNKAKKKKANWDERSLREEDEKWDPPIRDAARREPVPGDDGDEGIGRPFNVEHDLHVSPSLEDLPPVWLETLRSQGLSEQDLLLIASARKRQAAIEYTPIRRIADYQQSPTSRSSAPAQHATPSRRTTRIAPQEPLVEEPPGDIHDEDDELGDLGGGRRRSTKKGKRMSDQLRCFSSFDIGGEEGWAAGLLNAMMAEEHTTLTTSTTSSTPLPSPTSSTISGPARPPLAPGASPPRTPRRTSMIQRIPVPPLLPVVSTDTSLELDGVDALFSTQSWPSPPPPPPPKSRKVSAEIASAEVPYTPPADEDTTRPLRISSESFGVHYSHKQSRSSVDLDLITPSTSFGYTQDAGSTNSHYSHDERHDDGADLSFGDVLKETYYDRTPDSSVSEQLRDYLPHVPSSDHGRAAARFSSNGSRSISTHPNPAYSVPASISSTLPSRTSSPAGAVRTPDRTFLALPDPHDHSSPATPHGRATHDGRVSMALSILSSDGSHTHDSVHGATVQVAYTRMLHQLNQEDGRKRESAGVAPIVEESEAGDSEDEEGMSAMCALDDAARRIAAWE